MRCIEFPPRASSLAAGLVAWIAALVLSSLAGTVRSGQGEELSAWFFRPPEPAPRNELASLSFPLDGKEWAPVELPHDFTRVHPRPRDLLLDLEMVYDAAAAYLNGQLVGQSGGFPPEFFPQTAGRFRCIAPASLVQAKGNLIAIRVYNQEQFGGIVGLPAVDFELQERLNPYGTSAQEWAGALAKALEQPGVVGLALSLSEYLVHSGRLDEALALAAQCAETPAASARERQQARARVVHASLLGGKTDEAWLEFQKLDFALAIPFEAAYSASAVCRARSLGPPRLAYLGPDAVTGPDWDLHYGNARSGHAVLCAMGAPFDLQFGASRVAYHMETGDPQERPRSWLGKRETEDRRALFNPLTRKLRYASWDDAGERRPCDDAGPDLILHIPIPKGSHLLTFYLVDFDWHAGQHPRLQSLTLLDEGHKPLFVLGTGRFGAGRYERFLVEGPMKLRVRITKHRSACVVLSGLFVDKVLPLQPWPPCLPKPAEQVRALRDKYLALAAKSDQSLIETLRDTAFRAFEADCRRLAGAKKVQAEILWWLAECERVRGRPWAQVASLAKLLDRLAPKDAANYDDLARKLIGPFGLHLESLGFCNRVLYLCTERNVASAPERRPVYLRQLRRGSLDWRGPSGQPQEAKK